MSLSTFLLFFASFFHSFSLLNLISFQSHQNRQLFDTRESAWVLSSHSEQKLLYVSLEIWNDYEFRNKNYYYCTLSWCSFKMWTNINWWTSETDHCDESLENFSQKILRVEWMMMMTKKKVRKEFSVVDGEHNKTIERIVYEQ